MVEDTYNGDTWPKYFKDVCQIPELVLINNSTERNSILSHENYLPLVHSGRGKSLGRL